MNRTLLPIWNIYKSKYDFKPEPFEIFDWIPDDSDRNDYKIAQDGIDRIPGSREYLKNYVCPENETPFCDSIGRQIMFVIGTHHSISSGARLALNYKYLLNNWQSFVLETKTYYAQQDYRQTQIEEQDTWPYYNAKSRYNLLSNPYIPDSHNSLMADVDCEIEKLRQKFNINYTRDEIVAMLDDLIEEYNNERIEKKKKSEELFFMSRIDILEHHYAHPRRWNDTQYGSFLFGSPHSITEEMIDHMEHLYPDYRSHIESIKAQINKD